MSDGELYEQSNKLELAYDIYHEVWTRKGTTEAEIARMRVAQRIFDMKCLAIDVSLASREFTLARTQIDEAERYLSTRSMDHIDGTRIKILKSNWRMAYANSLLQSAKDALSLRNYSDAKAFAYQCQQLVFGHDFSDEKELKYILLACDLAPKYLSGVDQLHRGKCREAHRIFSEVHEQDPKFRWDGFENVANYLDSSIACGQFSLSCRVYSNLWQLQMIEDIQAQMHASVQSELVNDPFVILVESDQINVLADELKLYLEPTFNQDGNGPSPGNFLKSDYILIAELVNYEFYEFEEIEGSRKSCACSRIKDVKVNTERSECFEKRVRNKLKLQIQYKLIEVETARVVLAGAIPNLNYSGEYTSDGVVLEVAPKTGLPMLKSVKNKIKQAVEVVMGSDGSVTSGEYTHVEPKGEYELRNSGLQIFANYLATELKDFSPKK